MSGGGGGANRWLSPGVLFGIMGMFGAITAAWISFESRLAKVESFYVTMASRFERMEDKLDRLIERQREQGQ